MRPLRLACVRYLNTAPLIEGLDKLSTVTLLPMAPSRIADMVERGEADLGLASVIDAARAPLALLPVGMIGCDGPTLTVRVFSRVPLQEVREFHADTDSHTSVVLCRLMLKRLHGITPRIVDWDAAAGDGPTAGYGPQTILLIGDKVVTNAPPQDLYPHQLDLGEAWKRLTGLPFVYAVWMCREDRVRDEAILRAAELLDRQRRHNRTRLDWIASTASADHAWPADLAARYLGSLLTYDVGPREREAVAAFFGLAHEDGLLDRAVQPRWIEPASTQVPRRSGIETPGPALPVPT